jgi:hypothetical protein
LPVPKCTDEFARAAGWTDRLSLEERDVVGAFWRLAHHFVDLVSVWPDQNAPAIGLYAVEDDRRGLCRAGQRLVAKTPLELGHEVTQLIVR